MVAHFLLAKVRSVTTPDALYRPECGASETKSKSWHGVANTVAMEPEEVLELSEASRWAVALLELSLDERVDGSYKLCLLECRVRCGRALGNQFLPGFDHALLDESLAFWDESTQCTSHVLAGESQYTLVNDVEIVEDIDKHFSR